MSSSDRVKTKYGKDEFDLLSPPAHRRYLVRTGLISDIPPVYSLIDRHVPGPVAPPEAMKFAMMQNRNTLSVFVRGNLVAGFHAALLLAPRGLERLLQGVFDPLNPTAENLVAHDSTPAAIYVWMIIAPGLAIEGMRHVALSLRQPQFAGADLFSRPVTPEGERLLHAFGYHRLEGSMPNLQRYVRLANRSNLQRLAA